MSYGPGRVRIRQCLAQMASARPYRALPGSRPPGSGLPGIGPAGDRACWAGLLDGDPAARQSTRSGWRRGLMPSLAKTLPRWYWTVRQALDGFAVAGIVLTLIRLVRTPAGVADLG